MKVLFSVVLACTVGFSNKVPVYIHNTPTLMNMSGKGYNTVLDFEGENVSLTNYLPIPQYPRLLVMFHVRGVNIIGTKNPIRLEAPMFGVVLTQPTAQKNIDVSMGYVPLARKDSLQISERVNGLWGSVTFKQYSSINQFFVSSFGLYLPIHSVQNIGVFANSYFFLSKNTSCRVEGAYHSNKTSAGISIEHETGIIAFKTGVDWIWRDAVSPQILRYIGITVHFQPIAKK